jgi:hypothetical protein
MALSMSVATNFDPALPAGLAGLNDTSAPARVHRCFGSLAADCVGGGRPAHRLPQIGPERLAEHIQALAAQDIAFVYTLNAPDLFGSQDDPAWRRVLDRQLDELWELGVRRLVVSNRWLLERLRSRGDFLIGLSLIDGVASPEQAVAAAELGVESITLHGHRVARDLGTIERIRAATSLPLELNANMCCLLGCPWDHDHYVTLGDLSRADRLAAAPGLEPAEPHLLACSCHLLEDPIRFVLTTFVPPSYVQRYLEAGVSRFKFSDRASSTASLLRTVQAYGREDCETDLFELVYKGGSKLKAGLRGLFPDELVREIPVPRFSIDPVRFRAVDFIEQQAHLPEARLRALARSVITVHDPEYLARYLRFLQAVRDRLAWRRRVPEPELSAFAELLPVLGLSAR